MVLGNPSSVQGSLLSEDHTRGFIQDKHLNKLSCWEFRLFEVNRLGWSSIVENLPCCLGLIHGIIKEKNNTSKLSSQY